MRCLPKEKPMGRYHEDLLLLILIVPEQEWFTLTNKDKYCGEVYLELTFWSNVGAYSPTPLIVFSVLRFRRNLLRKRWSQSLPWSISSTEAQGLLFLLESFLPP